MHTLCAHTYITYIHTKHNIQTFMFSFTLDFCRLLFLLFLLLLLFSPHCGRRLFSPCCFCPRFVAFGLILPPLFLFCCRHHWPYHAAFAHHYSSAGLPQLLYKYFTGTYKYKHHTYIMHTYTNQHINS